MKLKFILASLALAFAFDAHAGAVVVGQDSSAASLNADQVRNIFLGRETSVGGQPAVIVFQRGGPLREKFDADVLGRPGAQLTSYWSRLVFTGRAKAPEELANDAAVKARVASTPGAIGYIDSGSVDGSVKVLFTF